MSAKSRLLFILFVAGFVTFAMGIEAALVLAGIGAVYYGIWRGALGSFRLLNDREVNRDFHEALAASHERTKAESDDPRDKIRAATSAVKLLAETMLSAGDNIVEREAAMWQAQNLAGSLLPYDEIESIIELRRRSGEAEVVGDLLKDLRRGFDLIARQDVYKACIEVSVADGKVPRIQSELLQMISDGVGLDRATARMLYNRTYTAYRRRQEEGQNRYGRDRGAKRKKRKAYTHTSGSSQVEQRSALEILGLSPGASASEIKRAYHKLAMRFHPDRLAACSEHERLEAEVRFKEIVAAYESLKG